MQRPTPITFRPICKLLPALIDKRDCFWHQFAHVFKYSSSSCFILCWSKRRRDGQFCKQEEGPTGIFEKCSIDFEGRREAGEIFQVVYCWRRLYLDVELCDGFWLFKTSHRKCIEQWRHSVSFQTSVEISKVKETRKKERGEEETQIDFGFSTPPSSRSCLYSTRLVSPVCLQKSDDDDRVVNY